MVLPINLIKTKLKEILREELPGKISHQKMLPPERNLSYPEEEKKQVKKSSVLVLVYPEGNELYTCLMKRPFAMRHHPGQISFPGGRIEEEDENEIAAALREANEEIGLMPEDVEIIGVLSDLYISISQFEISPVVAFSRTKPSLIAHPGEVEKLYYFPLVKQLQSEGFPKTNIETSKGNLIVPCIYFENEIIWGATAMILSELFDVLRKISFKQK